MKPSSSTGSQFQLNLYKYGFNTKKDVVIIVPLKNLLSDLAGLLHPTLSLSLDSQVSGQSLLSASHKYDIQVSIHSCTYISSETLCMDGWSCEES